MAGEHSSGEEVDAFDLSQLCDWDLFPMPPIEQLAPMHNRAELERIRVINATDNALRDLLEKAGVSPSAVGLSDTPAPDLDFYLPYGDHRDHMHSAFNS